MSLKTVVKRMESRLGLNDDHEIVFYNFPNEDGTIDVLHIASAGDWRETIDQEEYNRRKESRDTQ